MIATIGRVLGEGFRAFFLSAGLFAVLALVVWEGWLILSALGHAPDTMPFRMTPPLWHSHELIFGYGSAAMGGFLLTAVPNWTGTPQARHIFVGTAAAVWLAGRLAMFGSAGLPAAWVAVADLAFLPILAARVASQLIHRPKPQNLMFVLFISVIWTGDLLVQLDWTGVTPNGAELGVRIGLLGLCLMIATLGGRVTPAFTRNAMTRVDRTHGWPVSHRALDGAAIATLLGVPLVLPFSEPLAGGLALVSGGLQLARLAGWRSGWTLNQPILWALHVPFALLGLGLIALGAAWLGLGPEIAALHLLGIGAVGGMTLAVMSRAILGHSGRALVAPAPVAVAYGMIALAAVARWLGGVLNGAFYWPLVLTSGALWIVAFAVFVAVFWPALTRPRPARAPIKTGTP